VKIIDMICAPGRTGFFFDDQQAIKAGAVADGATYGGNPVTGGFSSVRQAGESISVMLILEDNRIAHGDCAAVQYSGTGGRDPLFLASEFLPVLERDVKPLLIGREAGDFRSLAALVDRNAPMGKERLHTAIRYGVTQALLDAVAQGSGRLMCDVVADEYGLAVSDTAIPIFMQSGDNRYDNADKMILKGADVLPHGLINHVETKLGLKGERLIEYVEWLVKRILALRPNPDYKPILHIDVYGTIGQVFQKDIAQMGGYLAKLEKAAFPFKLRIEGPGDAGERGRQISELAALTRFVDERGIGVKIVADEWCNTLEDVRDFADARAGHMIQIKTPDLGGIQNTVEAVLYCREKGVGAYQGGTCNETDRSAQVCVHLAMASKPDQILAKPGMGVDEGFMIVYNEMQRILALRKARRQRNDCGK
jgi:methylaspartate ammonia-lyase